jgi:hypothetical protein
MTGWHAERTQDRSAKAMIAVTLLGLLLVAAVPAALLAAVVMMTLGYVAGGLALSVTGARSRGARRGLDLARRPLAWPSAT